MEQKGCIYLVTCLINGKKYVGQHNKPDPQSRWQRHKRDAQRINKYPFHRAINKYGQDEFKWEIIYTGKCNTLDNMEHYYAEIYESYIWDFPGGYNAALCGNGGGNKHTPEACEKISKAKFGKKNTLEHIEKTRQASIGRKHSLEAKQKISQMLNGKPKSLETIENMRKAQILRRAKQREALSNSQASQLVSEDD